VDIDGNNVVIGAPDDGRHGSLAGAAYLYDWPTNTARFELVPHDIKSGDWFGISAALSGNYIVGGATKNQQGATNGSAYIFQIPEPPSSLLSLIALCGLAAPRVRLYRRGNTCSHSEHSR
jgi:hypothetical protein